MSNNVDIILKSISDEASSFESRTVKAAQDEASRIINEVKGDVKKRCDIILENAKKELEGKKKRIISSAKMEQKKDILKKKQELIKEAIDAAKTSIIKSDNEKYCSIIGGMLISSIDKSNGICDEFEVIVSESDRARITEEFIAQISSKTGTKISFSNEQRNIDFGFILKADDIEINCTFDAIIREKKDILEEIAANGLF